MTDITERLREHAAIHEAQVPFDNEQREWADDLRFAAAEIARLRARVAELETVEAAARVAELERTGSAVVARWDSPNWKDGTHTKDYIDALRAALAKDATP